MSPPFECHGCQLIPLYCLHSCFFAKFNYSLCFFFSSSACLPILLTFSQKILQYFSLRDSFFVFVWLLLAARRSNLVGCMCSMLPYGTSICCYAFMKFFNIFLLLLSIALNLVLINWQNGPRYQHVLALCASLTGAILRDLFFENFVFDACVCMFCFM